MIKLTFNDSKSYLKIENHNDYKHGEYFTLMSVYPGGWFNYSVKDKHIEIIECLYSHYKKTKNIKEINLVYTALREIINV